MNAEETKLLREVHAQLHNLFPSRVDFSVLGQGEPQQRVRDTVGGYAVNADARAYETRELVRAARTEIAALTRLIESQQAAIETVASAAAAGIGLTPDQIKDAVTAAIRDNLVRIEISGREAPPLVNVAGSPAGKD